MKPVPAEINDRSFIQPDGGASLRTHGNGSIAAELVDGKLIHTRQIYVHVLLNDVCRKSKKKWATGITLCELTAPIGDPFRFVADSCRIGISQYAT